MKNYIRYLLIFTASLSFISCGKDEVSEPVMEERTVIAYMAADNNLWDVAYTDIEEMRNGYSKTGVNLIVFIDAEKTP
jgi:hypothetical protein